MTGASDPFGPLVHLLAQRIASEVVTILNGGGTIPDKVDTFSPSMGDIHHEAMGPALERRALKELKQRKNREKYFPEEIFAEGAWNILLDLFAQKEKGVKIGITSACIASNIPATTALRWLDVLIMHGLIERTQSQTDRRAGFIELTPLGYRKMAEYLKSLT